MIKGSTILSIILLLSLNVTGQNKIIRLEEINMLQEKEPKYIAVLISTNWCKFCHAMKNNMLRNSRVSAVLAEKYYTVFLDAEDKSAVTFAGRNFRYEKGVNGFAKELGTINGQVSYPTLSVLNKQNEIIYQHAGYLLPDAMARLLITLSSNEF
jgi:thioredoxin-related protein